MLSFWSAIITMTAGAVSAEAVSNVIYPNNSLIWYHGRWDEGRGTWWAGTGLTLHVRNLSSLLLQLGPNTSQPVAVGLSVNYEELSTLKLINGTNTIPLAFNSTESSATTNGGHSSKPCSSVIRLNVEGFINNNVHLEKITLNSGATLLPYAPSRLNFQFIGDSLSSGYLLPNGVDGAWPFLTAEAFKAEQQVNAQPGACMTGQLCWGNVHGLTYQFFKTEDSGYYYDPKHNYTTDWDFRRDYRPTHIFVDAGTNDYGYDIPAANLTATYLEFIGKIRSLYPAQPLFVVGLWGFPNDDDTITYIYEGVYENVVATRKAMGDTHIYFIDTRGWVKYEDVLSDKTHPNPSGSIKIAGKLVDWLKNWGLQPQKKWATLVNRRRKDLTFVVQKHPALLSCL